MVTHRTLLACDMDGTVIPLEEGEAFLGDLAALGAALAGAPSLRLAYVTGRSYELALKGVAEYRLPAPEFLVCDVGTSLFHRTEAGFEGDREYARHMAAALEGVEAAEVRELLADVSGLTPQAPDRQTPFKVSFSLAPGTPHAEALSRVKNRLRPLSDRLQTVYSVRPADGLGLVDVLPAGVAKDFAVRYLEDLCGAGGEGPVYAGDSGNDMAVFLDGVRSVVVGNAEEELKEEIRARAGALGLRERIYFAEAKYAAGVLEGCRHFGLL